MMITIQDKHAWHKRLIIFPRVIEGRLALFESVFRRWNPKKYFRVIDPYDPGDYVGGWEYRLAAAGERQ